MTSETADQRQARIDPSLKPSKPGAPELAYIALAIFRASFADDEDAAIINEKWNEWEQDRAKSIRAARFVIEALGGHGSVADALEREFPPAAEPDPRYGKVHTDGSRSGGQKPAEPEVDPLAEAFTRILYDSSPHRAISPALVEATGIPLNAVIPYDTFIAAGGDPVGPRTYAKAVIDNLPDMIRAAPELIPDDVKREIAFEIAAHFDRIAKHRTGIAVAIEVAARKLWPEGEGK